MSQQNHETIPQLLLSLKEAGIRLWLEDDQLRYSARKGAMTADRRDQIQQNKPEILAYFRQASVQNGSERPPIQPVPRDGNPPLSFAQQRLWFLEQLEQMGAAYNISSQIRFVGDMDVSALERAINDIIARHESLRTTFALEEGEPVQVIASELEIPLSHVDMGNREKAELADELLRIFNEEHETPFDLSQGPLLRASLYSLPDDEHVLLVMMHHIISDAWSEAILIEELYQLYESHVRQEPSPLAPLAVQYADYAVWQREHLTSDVLERQISYWQGQMAGAPQLLDLPIAKPRPAVQTFRGRVVEFKLDSALMEPMQAICRQTGATPFMVNLAAFALLLHRYNSQEELVIGSPIANRNLAGTEQMIGFFVNTLLMRVNFADNPTFLELVQQVRRMALDAFANQDVPFDQVLNALQPQRSLAHAPLYQVVFDLQSTLVEQPESDFLDEINADLDVAVKFELALSMTWGQDRYSGLIEYNSALFDEETIERFIGHFTTLIEGIAADPEQSIGRLSLLSDNERQEIETFGGQAVAAPVALEDETTVWQRIERYATEQPEAIALRYASQSMTYAELNERANQLAHYLQDAGVGTDVPVVVYLERSVEMVVALLAVLKAQGAYVPVDTAYPGDRVAFMVEDSQAAIVLTQSNLAANLPDATAQLFCLDTEWEKVEDLPSNNLPSTPDLDSLAYIIYTSGSTGVPKGVMISHRGLLHLIQWHTQAFQVTAQDQATQIAGTAFDASVWELWPYLANGASVTLAEFRMPNSSAHLRDWLIENEISITFIPTPLVEGLLALEWPNDIPLRTILTGGDKLHRFPPTNLPFTLVNNYGPTENTVVATFGDILPHTSADETHSDVPSDFSAPSIGRPVYHTGAYILDEQMQPVPLGVPGELCLSGPSLARGYLNRPELTAEKFVEVDLGSGEPTRIYRTGDLVKFATDGTIDFLGRIDNQIKLRGFRIELGEIESALLQHDRVEECLVMAREDEPGKKQIVAYLVSQVSAAGESHLADEALPETLRRHLSEQLPDYMVPSAFLLIEEMPLTANGKVDRNALPIPESATEQSRADYVMPTSTTAQLIADIWQRVLQVDQIGLHDHFFELGGHSLLALEVHNELSQQVEAELSIIDLFKYPTVEALANYLDEAAHQQVVTTEQTDHTDQQIGSTHRLAGQIAIVGLAGRFPGANSADELWKNVRDGVESVTFFSDEELLEAGVDAETLADPNYVKASAILDNIEYFDSGFFGMTPNEAAAMDPQHRLFLECAQEVLEDAGTDPDQFGGKIGVFAGAGLSMYLIHNLVPSLSQIEGASDAFDVMLGNDKDFVPTRTSYKLNLNGPSVNVNTACSTSLVATHMACQSLLSYQCDMALAGGVSIQVPNISGYVYQEGMILSPDGHCRAFDAEAQGTVGGSGLGIVALKRLEDALADGDQIHAVILGSAINNDGAQKVGYTAPSVEGQSTVIREALRNSNVDAETIQYVESHGAGTILGDPIEMEAITKAYRSQTDATGFCAVGSVKTNVGHLDAAAGVTGLIKTVMALKHQQIPPSLNYETPNPQIDFANSPFCVSTELTEWQRNGTPRRAGVSSFGIGGTNAHLILQEAPEVPAVDEAINGDNWSRQEEERSHLLILSAHSAQALTDSIQNLIEFLRSNPEDDLGTIGYTLQVGRKALPYRHTVVARSHQEAIQALTEALELNQDPDAGSTDSDSPNIDRTDQKPIDKRPNLAFVFPDEMDASKAGTPKTAAQGALQSLVNIGRGFYATSPTFRASMDQCMERIEALMDLNLLDQLYPVSQEVVAQRHESNQPMNPAQNQAEQDFATFAIQYACAAMWQSWGIQPRAMSGSGVGEYVMACLSGVMALSDALTLVHARATCQLKFVDNQEAMQNAFQQKLNTVTLHPPRSAYVSSLSNFWISGDDATDPNYWLRTLERPETVAQPNVALLAEEETLLLTAGLVPTQDSAMHAMLWDVEESLGAIWQAGGLVNWHQVRGTRSRRRISLPTYPFQRQRYWIEPAPTQETTTLSAYEANAIAAETRQTDMANWFYVNQWVQSPPLDENQAIPLDESWVIFNSQQPAITELIDTMRSTGYQVFDVRAGEAYAQLDDRTFTLNPVEESGYDDLLDIISEEGMPLHYVQTLSLRGEATESASDSGSSIRDYMSTLRLVQGLNAYNFEEKLTLTLVTEGLHEILGNESLQPQNALLLGLQKVIGQELSTIQCRTIDIGTASQALPNRATSQSVEQLISELRFGTRLDQASEDEAKQAIPDQIVAYRGPFRWVQQVAPVTVGQPSEEQVPLREEGVYLITGGLGNIGFILADYLARTVQARLVLVGRTELPPETEWAELLEEAEATDALSLKIRRLQHLQASGAEVRTVAADMADLAQVEALLTQATDHFGPINGIFHAAGETSDESFELLQFMAEEDVTRQFRPKVEGVNTLAQALANQTEQESESQQPDFCVLMSSISSALGGLGFGAYAAANAYLDAFAQAANRTSPFPWFSFAWSDWHFIAEIGSPEQMREEEQLFELTAGTEMSPREGTEALMRLLAWQKRSHVMVSTSDLHARMRQWLQPRPSSGADGAAGSGQRFPRPSHLGECVAPRTETEAQICAIYEQNLGLEEVSIYDEFYELGGQSLLAIQIVSQLRETFQQDITIDILLEESNVANVAEYIDMVQQVMHDHQMVAEEEGQGISLGIDFEEGIDLHVNLSEEGSL
ncbi:MAG: amino acid adenylation domain-containing protein [Chloroflexota bacterium]